MYLGIEIGGTKLQLGVGADDGKLVALRRGTVDAARGAEGIREQIESALPTLPMSDVRGVGVGFGGPVDDITRTVIRSHQITGWDDFPLADWICDLVGCPTVLGNDADVAGLAEARHGAGKGLSPLFYMTIGTGIGGGLILKERIYRGSGRGAAEIGHMLVQVRSAEEPVFLPLESVASGSGMEEEGFQITGQDRTMKEIVTAALEGEAASMRVLDDARTALADALRHVILLLCPRRIVIGGGVSLMGEELLFAPLRQRIAQMTFGPFAGLTDIVPAALGEEVVVHGAIALARQEAQTRGNAGGSSLSDGGPTSS